MTPTSPPPASAVGRPPRTVVLLVLVAGLVALLLPASASAHAQLEGAVPAAGAVVGTAPQAVEFRFSEGVVGGDDALRVYAPDGERVDTGPPFHPDDAAERIAVRVGPELAPGTYTATYRVVSADGHPVSDGLVFSIGRPSATSTSLEGALAGTSAGPVTRTTFGVARAVQYLAIALGVGGLLFALLVLRPAGALGPRATARARRGVVLAATAGAVSAALGVVLEGAEGAGVSLWSALRPSVIGDSLDTRFGTVWALAAGGWVAIATAAALLLRPAPRRPTALAALLALPALFVLAHPGLAGHAATQPPRGVLFLSITVHVVAMAVWVGGIAALLLVVPAALRDVPAPGRTARLADVAGRFSRLAIWAVAGVALTGAVQGAVLVRTPDALVSTAHGRAVLIKAVLLLAIAAIAARNHRTVVPRLRAADAGAARALRRLVRGEAALLLAVLAVTGALSTYQPAVATPPGPQRVTAAVGPLRAAITVTPSRTGANAIRIALTDPRTGRPFTGARDVELTERPPGDGAALQQTATRSPSEPGVHTVEGVPLTLPGSWRVALAVRVSEFDQYDARVDVRVRR